jgi:hypothetical protein
MPNILKQYTRAYPNVQLPEALHTVAGDLVMRLLQPNHTRRLGSTGGAVEVREHQMFKVFDFEALRRNQLKAPYIPNVASMYDASNFEEPEVEKTVELDMDNSKEVVAGAPWALR